MTSSIITVRKQAIQNSPARNSMENHQGYGEMEDTNGTSQKDRHTRQILKSKSMNSTH
jgi:hypothetical protein